MFAQCAYRTPYLRVMVAFRRRKKRMCIFGKKFRFGRKAFLSFEFLWFTSRMWSNELNVLIYTQRKVLMPLGGLT